MGQNDVLLRLVEAMNLIYEQDGALPTQGEPLPGGLHGPPQVSDTGGHGGDGIEMRLGVGRDEVGKGGLAGAGRPPQQHRGHLVRFNGAAQDAVGAGQVPLPNEIVECAGPHAGREGRIGVAALLHGIGEKVRHSESSGWGVRKCRGERCVRQAVCGMVHDAGSSDPPPGTHHSGTLRQGSGRPTMPVIRAIGLPPLFWRRLVSTAMLRWVERRG